MPARVEVFERAHALAPLGRSRQQPHSERWYSRWTAIFGIKCSKTSRNSQADDDAELAAIRAQRLAQLKGQARKSASVFFMLTGILGKGWTGHER